MSAHTCPNCGHVYKAETKPKAPRLVPATDPSLMSDRELFAYYKRTAPLEDLRFLMRNQHTSANLRAACEVLEAAALTTTLTPAAFKAQYLQLQAQWRRDRNRADIAAHLANGDRYQGGNWIEPEPIQADEETAVA